MGSTAGVLKVAAGRVGVTVDEYQRRVAAGEKWCTAHKAWHPVETFPRDRSRGDGRKAKCLAADHGKPRCVRDPNRERARKRVAYEIRCGRLPHPSTVACSDCGHLGSDRRHEHDHYLGYDEAHHLDVQVVCTLCHADREKARRHG